jgi:hypothetical protein
MNVGEFLVQRLSEWGMRRIYGYLGEGINGIVGALARAQDRMEFVQVRPTLEVVLTEPPLHLRRRVDPENGLPLIAL